ncbi:MAG: zinc-binding alcohol dehydrogenase [Planctomycetota bacterium]
MPTYKGKAITFTARGKVELLDFSVEGPAAGKVIFENHFTAISPGTELSRLYDYHAAPRPFPQRTGYLSCGRVIDIGAGVKGIGAGKMCLSSCGHLPYAECNPADLMPVPDGVAPEEAVLGQLACVSTKGIRHAGVRPGDSVLVVGLGIIGQFAQMLARVAGGIPVAGVDLSERRLAIARQTGLAHAFNPGAKDYPERLKAVVPEGRFSVTIDSTGTPAVVSSLFERTADNGIVVVLGGVHKKVEVDLYTHFQKRNLRMVGAGDPSPYHWPFDGAADKRMLLALMAEGRLNVKPLITHRVPVAEAPEMYRMLHEEKDKGMGVVLTWKG